jgi:hypothetical protein
VVQRRRGPRLPGKAASAVVVRDFLARKNFDGHGPVQSRVVRPVHDTHATFTEFLDDLEVAECLTDHRAFLKDAVGRSDQLYRALATEARRALEGGIGRQSGSEAAVGGDVAGWRSNECGARCPR